MPPPLCQGRRSRPLDRCLLPSSFQLLASETKQTFLSTNLTCLLAFEWHVAGRYIHISSVTLWGSVIKPQVLFPSRYVWVCIHVCLCMFVCVHTKWGIVYKWIYLVFQLLSCVWLCDPVDCSTQYKWIYIYPFQKTKFCKAIMFQLKTHIFLNTNGIIKYPFAPCFFSL